MCVCGLWYVVWACVFLDLVFTCLISCFSEAGSTSKSAVKETAPAPSPRQQKRMEKREEDSEVKEKEKEKGKQKGTSSKKQKRAGEQQKKPEDVGDQPTEDDGSADSDLTLIGIVGIEDPLRPEVHNTNTYKHKYNHATRTQCTTTYNLFPSLSFNHFSLPLRIFMIFLPGGQLCQRMPKGWYQD